jgi:hypothetical protein
MVDCHSHRGPGQHPEPTPEWRHRAGPAICPARRPDPPSQTVVTAAPRRPGNSSGHAGGRARPATVTLVLSPLTVLVFVVVHQGLLGLYPVSVFLPNHQACQSSARTTTATSRAPQVLTAATRAAGGCGDRLDDGQSPPPRWPSTSTDISWASAPSFSPRYTPASSSSSRATTSGGAADGRLFRKARRVPPPVSARIGVNQPLR